jgi:hypothetical protein
MCALGGHPLMVMETVGQSAIEMTGVPQLWHLAGWLSDQVRSGIG